jgi:hypothetical protein
MNFKNILAITIMSLAGFSAFAQKKSLVPGESFPASGQGTKQTILSPNGQYMLAAVGSKFCVFKYEENIPYGPNADNKSIACISKPHFSNTRLVLQEDGNLVVLSNVAHQKPEIIWSSSTIPSIDPRFKDASLKPVRMGVGDDGTIVLYNAKGEKVWYHNIK